MHMADLTAPEQRVLGCLIEKRFTTPDQYPLSLNALRLACNQSTNRDPVVNYDEQTVLDAAQRLSKYGLARLASGHSSRATKYRHLAEEALQVDQAQLAIVGVLLLRGPQTPGELKGRTERMVPFASLEAVHRTLEELEAKRYARNIGRRPGQKEDRFEHLLGAADATPVVAAAPGVDSPATPSAAPIPDPVGFAERPAQSPAAPAELTALADRVAELEATVVALRTELADLRAELGA